MPILQRRYVSLVSPEPGTRVPGRLSPSPQASQVRPLENDIRVPLPTAITEGHAWKRGYPGEEAVPLPRLAGRRKTP